MSREQSRFADAMPEPEWLVELTARRGGIAYDLLLTVRAEKTERFDIVRNWCAAQGFAMERPGISDLEEAGLDSAAPIATRGAAALRHRPAQRAGICSPRQGGIATNPAFTAIAVANAYHQ